MTANVRLTGFRPTRNFKLPQNFEAGNPVLPLVIQLMLKTSTGKTTYRRLQLGHGSRQDDQPNPKR